MVAVARYLGLQPELPAPTAPAAREEESEEGEEEGGEESEGEESEAEGEPAAAPTSTEPEPLDRTALTGRHVMIPRAAWPEEPCDELDGAGWAARIISAKHAAVSLRCPPSRYIYTFAIGEVMGWRVLL